VGEHRDKHCLEEVDPPARDCGDAGAARRGLEPALDAGLGLTLPVLRDDPLSFGPRNSGKFKRMSTPSFDFLGGGGVAAPTERSRGYCDDVAPASAGRLRAPLR